MHLTQEETTICYSVSSYPSRNVLCHWTLITNHSTLLCIHRKYTLVAHQLNFDAILHNWLQFANTLDWEQKDFVVQSSAHLTSKPKICNSDLGKAISFHSCLFLLARWQNSLQFKHLVGKSESIHILLAF